MVNASTPSSNRAEAAQRVRELADELGFAMCGITDAKASDHAAFVRQWLAERKHGEMQYLANHVEVRLDPGELLPGARSIVVVADVYPNQPVDGGPQAADEHRGRIARYAWGDDYHKTMKQRLHQLADALRERYADAQFRATVDTAPLLEREHAARAGLGWIGKHTLTLHPRLGSYLLLGGIVTTLDLAGSGDEGYPGHTVPPTDHCGTCTRCIDACPTQCIANPSDADGHRTLDATRCISYLTLEHRSAIDESLHAPMGDWLAGCDVCQQVCPYNQPIETSFAGSQPEIHNARSDIRLPVHPRYTPRPELTAGLDLRDVLNWTAEDRQRVFQGSALKRMKLEMVKRNALIVAGNALMQHDDPPLRQRVHELADDENEHALVRESARQVLARLESKKPTA